MPYEITKGFLYDERRQHLRIVENNNRIKYLSKTKMNLEDSC